MSIRKFIDGILRLSAADAKNRQWSGQNRHRLGPLCGMLRTIAQHRNPAHHGSSVFRRL